METGEESVDLGDSGEEWGFAESQISPYRDEPLADVGNEDTSMNEEEDDANGLTPAILEGRYKKTVSIDSW